MKTAYETSAAAVAAAAKLLQSCLTLCDPIDRSPPDFSIQGILQARILEWVAIPFSGVSSQSRDQTQVSHIAGRFFTSWATREDQEYWTGYPIPSSGDLPNPGIEPRSPALQADSLPTELQEKSIKKKEATIKLINNFL